eukprot:TRINITY_DN51305_c0_g1_i1.p1 TRINITY_DN51305_c0_g1~~TRINITY_DN51305_c0_g1_i1.p1  ORF type:complete len:454 (-),score=96.77 TRINITY_DN51305_c0_g1_i1:122-1483(-)
MAGRLQRHLPLLLMGLTQLFLTSDQSMLSVNMTPAALEFGFSDVERDEKLGGEVTAVFFSSSAAASVIAGRLADYVPRRQLIAGLAVIGGISTAATARVTSFEQLLLCRAGVGLAVGGVAPVIFSLVGDLYIQEERPRAFSALSIISGLGPGLGQWLAAWYSRSNWRSPFAIVGISICIFSVLLPHMFVSHKRVDSKVDDGDSDAKSDLAAAQLAKMPGRLALWSLLRTPSALMVFLQGLFGCIPWAVITTFLTDYLVNDNGLSVEAAAAVFMFLGIGCTTGTILGGQLGGQLYRRDKRLQPVMMAFTVFAGIPPVLLMFTQLDGIGLGQLTYFAFAFLGGSQAAVSGNNAKAILLNTTPPSQSGLGFGILRCMDDMGKSLGPLFVSRLVRSLGRQHALMLGILCWLPCGVCCAVLCVTVAADEAAAKLADKRKLEISEHSPREPKFAQGHVD